MSQILLRIEKEGIRIAELSALGRKFINNGGCEEATECWKKESEPMSLEKVIVKIKKIQDKEK